MKKLAFLLLILLAACAPAEKIIAPEEKNVTKEGATFGDLVSINFILSLENGTIVDTNNPEIAKEYGIRNYVEGPFKFILGESGKVKGFDTAILGMNEGEHKEMTIEPSEEEVVFTINKIKAVNRFLSINKKQAFPRSAFERHFKKPVIGKIVYNDTFAFKYKVLNFTNESVITEMVLKEGEKYVLPNTFWNSSVVKVAEEDVMFYQQPEENQTIDAPFGKAVINMSKSMMFLNYQPELNKIFNKTIEIAGGFGIPRQFQVTEISDEDFIIKQYGSLADKILKLKVDMLNRTKNVKKVKQKTPLVTEVQGGTEN